MISKKLILDDDFTRINFEQNYFHQLEESHHFFPAVFVFYPHFA